MDDRPAPEPVDQRSPLTEPLSGRGWSARTDREGTVVVLTGDWIASASVGAEPGSLRNILDATGNDGISFDSKQLGRWDSSLLVFVSELRQAARKRDIAFDATGLPQAAARLLALISQAAPVAARARRSSALVTRVGQAVIDAGGEAAAVTSLVGDTVLSCGTALRGRVSMRGVDLLDCMREAGVAALPIVTVVNVLIGGIVAFVGAVQLRRFGADVFIADLVGVAMVREMAALMTAIVMSGRTGGAYAAHIATMLGNEEIDALRAIGIPINDYLILPRILALTGMMPLLYLYGSAVGIFGGFVVAVTMLNISPDSFIDETRASIALSQILFGLVKSFAFGALIAIVGCRSGLGAGRSAADVGQAATRAVVIGIVGVIALDAVFAICANALDF
jgi:phospholipid/cholesterol/gamma-HCH transport system permease protein